MRVYRYIFIILSSIIICFILWINTLLENNKNLIINIQTQNINLHQIINNKSAKIENLNEQIIDFEKFFNNRVETLIIITSGQGVHMNIHSPSGFTSKNFEKAWEVLGASNMSGTGIHFVQAEITTGINAIFLAAIAYHESAGGTSKIALYKNNLFGWQAYDINVFHYAKSFESKGDGIQYVAEKINEIYFGQTLNEIGQKYASDPEWANKVSAIMKLIVLSAY